MEFMINIARVIKECNKLFRDDSVKISLNEALVLYSIYNGNNIAPNITKFIDKDRGYVHRLIKSLGGKGLVRYCGGIWCLTLQGKRELNKAQEICDLLHVDLIEGRII